MPVLLQVALGGALGASLRFLSGAMILRAMGSGFPYGTMFVNVIGSFLMGAFVIFAAHRGLTYLSPFVMTGLLGGFTTFSAFSLETVTLMERGAFGYAALYVSMSVILSVTGLFLGLMAAKGVLA